MSARWHQLVSSFRNKDYRHAFVENHIGRGLAFQIRAMQQARGWNQRELGDRLAMSQPQVSQLENPNYGQYTIKTLRRIAKAFDVALIVKFAPFSDLIGTLSNLSSENLEIPDFDHDPGLQEAESIETVLPVLSSAKSSGGLLAHVIRVPGTQTTDFALEPDNVISMVPYLTRQVHTVFQLTMPLTGMTAQPIMEDENVRESN